MSFTIPVEEQYPPPKQRLHQNAKRVSKTEVLGSPTKGKMGWFWLSVLRELGVDKADIREEWHRQPVSTIVHVVTLIVIIAGFLSLLSVQSYKNDLQEIRLEKMETSDKEEARLYGVHEAKIQVLESRLGGIETKMGSIDGKMDALLMGENGANKKRD